MKKTSKPLRWLGRIMMPLVFVLFLAAGQFAITGIQGRGSDDYQRTMLSMQKAPLLENSTSMKLNKKVTAPVMEVHFIDVGQADCILIKSGDRSMLVDAGNNDDAETIVDYLDAQGIKKLDYVIGTHPHEDHIGSLDTVIDTYDIGKVIMPKKAHTSQTFEDVVTSMENKKLSITAPKPGQKYTIGGASFTIIAPNGEYEDDLSNWSVGIKLTNGKNNFILAGDAEEKSEEDILSSGIDITADVLKVSHHGSDTSSTNEFIQKIKPDYAVISCGERNTYGHPNLQTLTRLDDADIQIFRTDEEGTIIAKSDGTAIKWNKKASTSMKPGQQKSSSAAKDSKTPSSNTTGEQKAQETTVHITKSGSKYHQAGCRYLKKSDSVVTLKKAKSLNLTPCSECSPPVS